MVNNSYKCSLSQTGVAAILSSNCVGNFYICNGSANTETECQWEYQASRFCCLGGLWSTANVALEYRYGWHGQSDR